MEKPVIYTKKPRVLAHKIINAFDSAIKELYFITNPHIKKNQPGVEKALIEFKKKQKPKELWIFFPWNQTLIHTVDEQTYYTLRTSRNRDIITVTEQLQFRKCFIGIAGLSVGSAILQALTISGGPKHIKIADFDTLEITNLNRINASLCHIGKNKTHIAAQQVWEKDPFAKLDIYDKGLTKKSCIAFLLKPKLDIFIDEMDSLDLKILMRLACKLHKIPVLMATDNGDSVILDVERFDVEPKHEIFYGLIKNEVKFNNLKSLTYAQWLRLATKIVGPEYLTERMQQSLMEINKTIPAVPQLGTTASMAGSAIAYCARRIANHLPLPSGRYTFGLEEKLIPYYSTPRALTQRKKKTDSFKHIFDSQT